MFRYTGCAAIALALASWCSLGLVQEPEAETSELLTEAELKAIDSEAAKLYEFNDNEYIFDEKTEAFAESLKAYLNRPIQLKGSVTSVRKNGVYVQLEGRTQPVRPNVEESEGPWIRVVSNDDEPGVRIKSARSRSEARDPALFDSRRGMIRLDTSIVPPEEARTFRRGDQLVVTGILSSIIIRGGEPPRPGPTPTVFVIKADKAEMASLAPQRRAICDALIHDILTNPALKEFRDFYGMPDDTKVALVQMNGYGVRWPPSYKPSIEGFRFIRAIGHSPDARNAPRLLGIRLDKFRLDEDSDSPLGGQIEVTLLNAGGDANESIHTGGCIVNYNAQHENTGWKVEFRGALDP